MTEEFIDTCCREIARILMPSGHLALWSDTFNSCEENHLRIADPPEWLKSRCNGSAVDVNVLKVVDLIAWDSLRIGMGKRSRRRGDYLLILQKPPIHARTWRDHAIPSRWPERVDRNIHAHIKPIGLIGRLISALTEPGDLVVDPAAGSFVVMKVAHQLGRHFVGCDCEWRADEDRG